jgi:hypothetical protein
MTGNPEVIPGPKSASGKRATADRERLAEDREPKWPKANCGFLARTNPKLLDILISPA